MGLFYNESTVFKFIKGKNHTINKNSDRIIPYVNMLLTRQETLLQLLVNKGIITKDEFNDNIKYCDYGRCNGIFDNPENKLTSIKEVSKIEDY